MLSPDSDYLNASLRPPQNDAEWSVYHEIRRRVLFELRGNRAYVANHPDEYRPGNHPLVLWIRGAAVGVIRVDIVAARAVFRRVAVPPDLQRRGYGRLLLELAEDFAKTHGCTHIESHVDGDAVPFYELCGFQLVHDNRQTDSGTLMEKAIA